MTRRDGSYPYTLGWLMGLSKDLVRDFESGSEYRLVRSLAALKDELDRLDRGELRSVDEVAS